MEFNAFASFVLCIIAVVSAKNDVCQLSHCSQNATATCATFGYETNGICCSDENEGIVGVDIRSCKLSSSDLSKVFSSASHPQLRNVSFVVMDGSNVACPGDMTFYGYPHLVNLTVGFNCSCPGGDGNWEKQTVMSPVSLTCTQPLPMCSSDRPDYACPQNSYCVEYGPGIRECLCNSTYHGYKCLKMGSFPEIAYLGGWIGSTVATAIGLFFLRTYYIQRGANLHSQI